ncbi:MAG: SDR family NAD(P)-dependent oxidoreductase [Candidatus Helarchaeota archaeon]
MINKEEQSLFDKTALITGAGSGIGRATSLRLAKEGAKVIVVDINLENAQDTVDLIKKQYKNKAIAMECDISNVEEVKHLVRRFYGQFRRLDILFNNAGIGTFSYGELISLRENIWDEVMSTNLRGTWLVTKYFVKKMRKQEIRIGGELRGKIINNASLVGKEPMSPLGAYSISKAGVIAMTHIFAQELAPYKITVNAVCPGFHLTGIYLNDEKVIKEIMQKWGRKIPLERYGTSEDVANVVFFLASDDSNYLTGQSISCDGGCHFS